MDGVARIVQGERGRNVGVVLLAKHKAELLKRGEMYVKKDCWMRRQGQEARVAAAWHTEELIKSVGNYAPTSRAHMGGQVTY